MDPRDIKRLIETAVELGATTALVAAGLQTLEITQTQALKVYGGWFRDAVRDGKVRPCRVDTGHRGTKWYSREEILAAKTYDTIPYYFKDNS